MRFVWFWTFWHWSKESFRDGVLLRSPLHGVASHWDEWFHHEASANDRKTIEETGRTESTQRQFVAWLFRYWAGETESREKRMVARFVVSQLAQMPPFNKWQAFEKYRTSYGVTGISAIVLAEDSAGEPEDVRTVEAIALPTDSTEQVVVTEGFQADPIELETPRRAAISLLRGKGFLAFLALWLAAGQRPYPQWLKAALGLGWLAVGGLILYLLVGPDPGDQLVLLSAMLVALWTVLVLVAVTITGSLVFRAWRQGRNWCAKLEQAQLRLRMNGGLTLKGASAGLPFCFNTLLALYRGEGHQARRSWLWHRPFHNARSRAQAWAATGVITSEGYLKPVVLEPKVRACSQCEGIKHILTPRQPGAGRQRVNRLVKALIPPRHENAPTPSGSARIRLGFAAEERCVRVHPCRHVAQALMILGEFTSAPQAAFNLLAVAASVAMLLAVHNLRSILLPPLAPLVVAPSSGSPSALWVSLATKSPEDYLVVFESEYWSNRRAPVTPHSGVNGSMRAEIQLQRSPAPLTDDRQDGIVWVERRHRFLIREFAPGERIGRYDISYLNRLGHESFR
jgi:hypothetical protein